MTTGDLGFHPGFFFIGCRMCTRDIFYWQDPVKPAETDFHATKEMDLVVAKQLGLDY